MAAQSGPSIANAQVRLTRYSIFLEVVRQRSFTKVAKEIGYTQSAVSQTVKALERELGVTLVERGKDGVTPTKDGRQFMPYLQALARDEAALDEKRREVQGLGVTVLYEMMLMGFESGVAVRPIREEPKRTITLGWRSSKTLPLAARRFSEYIIRELG